MVEVMYFLKRSTTHKVTEIDSGMATIHYDSSKGAKGVGKVSFSMPLKVGIVARRALGPVPRHFLISKRMEHEPLWNIVYFAWGIS